MHTRLFGTIRVALGLLGLCSIGDCAVVIKTQAPSGLSIHDVGEYGGVPWQKPGTPVEPGSRMDRVKDLNLAISSVNLSDNVTDKFLTYWATVAKWGHAQGKKFLPRVYFWDGKDRFTGPMQPVEVYWKRMDRFLSAMDLSDFYAICLAEENVAYAGRPQVLTELYNRIKAKYKIKVYQWWSPQTFVPGFEIPTDGWIIDIYQYGGTRFRQYVQRYLITGEPVVVMSNATLREGKQSPWTAVHWKILDDQLQVCREYNLPTVFFWNVNNGCNFGMKLDPGHAEVCRRVLAWVKEARSFPRDYQGLPSADVNPAPVLELGPDARGRFSYSDSFQTSQFILDAGIEGFRNLLWEKERTLAVRSWNGRKPEAALIYQFAGDFTARFPRAEIAVPFLAPGSKISLAVSADGKTWLHAVQAVEKPPARLQLSTAGDPRFAAVRSFFVRVDMKGEARTGQVVARIDDVKIDADLAKPAAPVVFLKPLSDNPGKVLFEENFQTQKYLFVANTANKEKLEWSRGRIAVRMRPGDSSPSVIWHVKSAWPVRNILIDVTGRANTGSLGTNHFVDVSVDGKTWTHEVNTLDRKVNRIGWADHGLTIRLAGEKAFTGVNDFFVRLRMKAPGYTNTHPAASGIVTQVRIEAEH